MARKHRLALWILLLAAIIIVGGVYLLKKEQSKPNLNEQKCETCHLSDNLAKELPAASISATAVKTLTPLEYSNSDYGFKITLSEVWRDSQITEQDDPQAVKKIVFSFRTADKNYQQLDFLAPALTIYIFNKSDWDKRDLSSRSPIKIADSGKYVFSYLTWETTPQDLEYITDKELADVIGTFKLTD